MVTGVDETRKPSGTATPASTAARSRHGFAGRGRRPPPRRRAPRRDRPTADCFISRPDRSGQPRPARRSRRSPVTAHQAAAATAIDVKAVPSSSPLPVKPSRCGAGETHGEQPRRDDGGPAAGQRPGRRAGRRRGDSGGRNGQQPGHRVPARGRHQPVGEEEALGSVDPGHVAVQRLAPRPQPGHLGEAGLVGAERDGQEPGAEDGAEDDGEADAGHRGAAAEA